MWDSNSCEIINVLVNFIVGRLLTVEYDFSCSVKLIFAFDLLCAVRISFSVWICVK